MVTQLAAALVATGEAAEPFGVSPTPRGAWRTADDDARLLRYRLFLNFDAGKHDVGRLPMGQNPVQANYARVFVRKAASYLFPEPVAVTVAPPDDTPDAAAVAEQLHAALTLVRTDNDLDAADLATAVDAAVLGDGCFKVTWDARRARPRIVPVDVQRLFVATEPDDVRRARLVRDVRTMTPDDIENAYGLARLDLPDAERLEVAECWTADAYWLEIGGAPTAARPNPYGFIPYLIFPNTPRPHAFWGLSDLADIIDVNRALDRRLSTLAALLELSGNPVTVLENVTGAAGINVAPGAVWEVPENAKAYVLELLGSGTVDQHLRAIEALYRIMDDLSEMPRMSFGDAGQARSGVALQIQLQPVVQKIRRKRLVWDGVVTRRARYALALMARFGTLDLAGYALDEFTLTPVWAPILPSDRQALVADEIALHQAGLHSARTAMAAVGVEDVDAEARRIAGESAVGGRQ